MLLTGMSLVPMRYSFGSWGRRRRIVEYARMNNSSRLKVIVSNGFNRYPLSRAAAEVHKRGLLARFITGAYPTPAVRQLAALTRFDRWSGKAARLLDRGEKELPDDLVAPLWLSEAV